MIKGLKYRKGFKKHERKKKSKPNKNQTRRKQSWLPREENSTLDQKVELQSRKHPKYRDSLTEKSWMETTVKIKVQ